MVLRREGTIIHTAMTIMLVQGDHILFYSISLTFLQFSILLLLLCRSTISVGIRRKNNPLTCTDSAASWPNSAGKYFPPNGLCGNNEELRMPLFDIFLDSLRHSCCLCISLDVHYRECESLGLEDFPTSEQLHWHGHHPGKPDWSEGSRFVAFSMVRI